MRTLALGAAALLAVLPAIARADDPVGAALVTKFGACFEAQGGTLAEEDRAVLEASSADLAAAANIQVGGVSCAAPAAPDVTPPSVAACTAVVNALPCDDFGAEVGNESASLAALPPPPPWAVSYARALLTRTADCYAAEVGSAVTADQRAQLDGFGEQLASGIGVTASGGACVVHEDQLATCTSWLAGRGCDALLTDLSRMLGIGDGTATPAAATTTTADGVDADTASDEELDAHLAAAHSDGQATASQLIGPCAALVDCSTDLDATLDAAAPPDDQP